MNDGINHLLRLANLQAEAAANDVRDVAEKDREQLVAPTVDRETGTRKQETEHGFASEPTPGGGRPPEHLADARELDFGAGVVSDPGNATVDFYKPGELFPLPSPFPYPKPPAPSPTPEPEPEPEPPPQEYAPLADARELDFGAGTVMESESQNVERYNQSEQLISSIEKKDADSKQAIIDKIGREAPEGASDGPVGEFGTGAAHRYIEQDNAAIDNEVSVVEPEVTTHAEQAAFEDALRDVADDLPLEQFSVTDVGAPDGDGPPANDTETVTWSE